MKNQRGFTIMELMIAVALVAILTMVAYPSYNSHLAKGTRSQAQQAVMATSQRLGEYFLDARQYTTTFGAAGLNLGNDGFTCNATCENDHYSIAIAVPDPGQATGDPRPSFLITATPKAGGKNAGEAAITLNSQGAKSGPWR